MTTKNIMNKEVEHKNNNIFFQKSTGLNFNKSHSGINKAMNNNERSISVSSLTHTMNRMDIGEESQQIVLQGEYHGVYPLDKYNESFIPIPCGEHENEVNEVECSQPNVQFSDIGRSNAICEGSSFPLTRKLHLKTDVYEPLKDYAIMMGVHAHESFKNNTVPSHLQKFYLKNYEKIKLSKWARKDIEKHEKKETELYNRGNTLPYEVKSFLNKFYAMALKEDRITLEWIRKNLVLLDDSLMVLIEKNSIPNLKWLADNLQ